MTKYIIISGVDGSGKTTVINSLKDKLEQQGKTVDYIWMRYNHYTVKAMNTFGEGSQQDGECVGTPTL